jgi:hypothetical protein
MSWAAHRQPRCEHVRGLTHPRRAQVGVRIAGDSMPIFDGLTDRSARRGNRESGVLALTRRRISTRLASCHLSPPTESSNNRTN